MKKGWLSVFNGEARRYGHNVRRQSDRDCIIYLTTKQRPVVRERSLVKALLGFGIKLIDVAALIEVFQK